MDRPTAPSTAIVPYDSNVQRRIREFYEMAEMGARFPEMTWRFPELLSRLSARDRAVYALDLPRYEACPHSSYICIRASLS